MARKRISALLLSLEELEYVLDLPQGHHIENVVYDPLSRSMRVLISGDSMYETYPHDPVMDMRLGILMQRFRGKKKKHTELPMTK